MHKRSSDSPTPSAATGTSASMRLRLAVVLLASLSMLATSGLHATPAQAQGATQFVFEGAGWGHGVGMSQNGARNLANAGGDHVNILNFYYPNTILSPVPTIENIRVHIGDSSRVEMTSEGSMVFDRGGVAINALPSGSITVSAVEGGLQIGNAWSTATPADPVFVSFPQPVTLANNGHRYLWGRLQLTNKNGQVRVVETLPLEQYVAGISEMPAAWPLEALMAQAIAARTYAHEVTLHRRSSAEWAQEYDISGSTVDQNYIGYDAQDSAWDQKWLAAVTATAGVEIVDSNGPIRAYYSASNGGYTETADYVFSNNVPYTVAGPDPYDAGGHDWTTWTRTYTQESISRWFNAHADTSVGTLTAINVLGGEGASARLDKAVVELVGTAGTKRVTGRRMMIVMNAGIFDEGGGLSTHLPGTFTTIGNGVAAGPPQPSGASIPAVATPDPVAEGASDTDGFTPPPGWVPEPGTGVPPGVAVPPTGAGEDGLGEDDAAVAVPAIVTPSVDGSTYTPPEGWEPEPGTGVPPGTPVPPGDPVPPGTPVAPDVSNAAVPDTSDYTPPDGWEPEPGTGVPPGQPVAPLSETSSADTRSTNAAAADTSATATDTADTTTVGGSGGGDAPTSSYTPPEGWEPEPGTGVPPGQPVAPISSEQAQASGVLLVTRTADGAEITEANFEVISPTEDRAAEARERLDDIQKQAALGLFADLDVDGYVASMAPRPVHAVCTATADAVTCVPIEAVQNDG